MLQLIAQGNSNKEIAAMLQLSVNTVSVHRANLMEALDIHRTAELVVYAIRKGLVTLAVSGAQPETLLLGSALRRRREPAIRSSAWWTSPPAPESDFRHNSGAFGEKYLPGDAGRRLRLSRLRQRRLAGHPAGQRHGLARPQAAAAARCVSIATTATARSPM